MHEPEFRTSRIAIALGFLAVLAVGGGGFLIGRYMAPQPHATQAPPPAPMITLPTERPLLSRADFLSLAGKAADAVASGTPMPQDVRDAAGRRFDLVMPVGCDAPSDERKDRPSWSYDESRGRLRITIPAITWEPADWRLGDKPKINAIEGFWITRPWTSSDTCPAPVALPMPAGQPAETPAKGSAPKESAKPDSDKEGTPPVTAAEDAAPAPLAPRARETLAVAQFFLDNGTTGIRRMGRPYSIITRIAPDQLKAAQGFRIRLTGRIDRVPGGDPVQCTQPLGRDNPPSCVVATVLDEVRVENPATGAVLATWSAGHSSR